MIGICNLEDAESFAIKALEFLSEDNESLVDFLSVTGLKITQLRDVAKDPGFFAAVVNFFQQNEKLLSQFAQRYNYTPLDIATVSKFLNGHDPY